MPLLGFDVAGVWTCVKCGHRWRTRQESLFLVPGENYDITTDALAVYPSVKCPKCSNPNWNEDVRDYTKTVTREKVDHG
jgi:predicted nucleic-acid-binding Zn-ribbon protein